MTLTGRMLQSAAFQTNNVATTTSRAPAGCMAVTPLFPPAPQSLVCPAAAGRTCTYYVHLETHVLSISTLDDALFRFLIDGAAPSPGATNASGFVRAARLDCGTAKTCGAGARSGAVTGTVTNNTANSAHTVEVDIACKDVIGSDGCSLQGGFANVEINTHKP
jgi:hypothetical protein